MRYLLDTHVWIWMHAFPEMLSAKAEKTLTRVGAEDELLLSAISLYESAATVPFRSGRPDDRGNGASVRCDHHHKGQADSRLRAC